ncbi:MAG: hypothetical protein M1834_008379 [Cirrosporium novae-zelandiae]|nr:MAG: hypothetical protein M1834_008379 [Cirrosporium novae-zelandiae]
MDASQIYAHVQSHYGSVAKDLSNTQYGQNIASAFGYSPQELAEVPEGANLGLSCGNPMAIAKLRDGETVIDLGSGAGFDVFLAAKSVGPSGRAIGVDMNKSMLERANKNKQKAGAANVTFVESPITRVDLPSSIADCITSNCVINLVPEKEKQLVFNEMFRLLKPGGRLAISDILAKTALPEGLKSDMAMYVGCIGGASEVGAYEKYLREAGFMNGLILDSKSDLNVYKDTNESGTTKGPCGTGSGCCGSQASPSSVEGQKGSLKPCGPSPAGGETKVPSSSGESSGGSTAAGCSMECLSCCEAEKTTTPATLYKEWTDVDLNQWAGKDDPQILHRTPLIVYASY